MISMKLLVTGGLGFIGSNFIRLMLHEHDDIQILNIDDLRLGSNPENLLDLNEDPTDMHFARETLPMPSLLPA